MELELINLELELKFATTTTIPEVPTPSKPVLRSGWPHTSTSMTYQSVWWYPNYIEYGSGLNPPKTWPKVMEQYRRPDALQDLRYYDLPVDEYQAKLYYNLPKLGTPKYRATFRDKPHTVSRHYPNGWPEGKPPGFFGRVYYEDGPPKFKYDGPNQDKLYWLERPPYLPKFNKRQSYLGKDKTFDSMRGLNPPPEQTNRAQATYTTSNATYGRFGSGSQSAPTAGHTQTVRNPTKRITQDGVGYL
ncbi:hypothetical protein LSH36_77g03055 [Paralvinella palmiformis]|uniref:Uncharacterized protein n=1 Tax=Paralvinella palmiformis TaxID=53620 RepID=A0AAD9K3A6_9ANNE|nr:hypothetical protein LSH36_77g03055 [Paralvinella palmiformis]